MAQRETPPQELPLVEILRRRIKETGPIGVDEYMAAALGHPDHGYYMGRDPLGRAGDFITAPEISQVFGELVGAWCAVAWEQMGRPDPVVLAELGPGRGTLMADALRATRSRPAFLAAARLSLIETSPVLRDLQRRTLADAHPDVIPHWHHRLDETAAAPLLLIANEFFDALPIRQYVRNGGEWRERRIGLAGNRFAFVLGEATIPTAAAVRPGWATALDGTIVEVCPAAIAVVRLIAQRVRRHGGAALIIDYGDALGQPGDTLQSVHRHAFHDVLDRPGEADLTAHVDFAALADAAEAEGAQVWGPLPQGIFLSRLGIEVRTRRLAASAAPERAAELMAGYHRLVRPSAMGLLFKAFVVASPTLSPPPGFS